MIISFRSASQTQLADELTISFDIPAREVFQEPAAPADQLKQSPSSMVVLRVKLEVFGQIIDAIG